MIDPKDCYWFPMRVTYSREMQVKDYLDSLGVECFLPLHYVPIKGRHPRHQELKPVINNLIFLHSSQESITELKNTRAELLPLRYMTHPVMGIDGKNMISEIMTIPELQMDNFIRVASDYDHADVVVNTPLIEKPGQRVRIVEGKFAGVEGVIKRVRGNKHVVVQLEHVAMAAIVDFVPKAWLLLIDEEKTNKEVLVKK